MYRPVTNLLKAAVAAASNLPKIQKGALSASDAPVTSSLVRHRLPDGEGYAMRARTLPSSNMLIKTALLGFGLAFELPEVVARIDMLGASPPLLIYIGLY